MHRWSYQKNSVLFGSFRLVNLSATLFWMGFLALSIRKVSISPAPVLVCLSFNKIISSINSAIFIRISLSSSSDWFSLTSSCNCLKMICEFLMRSAIFKQKYPRLADKPRLCNFRWRYQWDRTLSRFGRWHSSNLRINESLSETIHRFNNPS